MQRKNAIKILAIGSLLFVLPFLAKFPSSAILLVVGIVMVPIGLWGLIKGSTTPSTTSTKILTPERKTNWPIIIGVIVAISLWGTLVKPNKQTASTVATEKSATNADLEASCAKGDPYKAFAQLHVWNTDKEPVLIHVRPEYWALLKNNPDQKRQFIEAAANTDACIEG